MAQMVLPFNLSWVGEALSQGKRRGVTSQEDPHVRRRVSRLARRRGFTLLSCGPALLREKCLPSHHVLWALPDQVPTPRAAAAAGSSWLMQPGSTFPERVPKQQPCLCLAAGGSQSGSGEGGGCTLHH